MWQENETSIIIKMLDRSMKERDQPRTLELQKSLLELERKSDTPTDELDLKQLGSIPIQCKSKSLTLESSVSSPSELTTHSDGSPFSPKEREYLKKAMLQNTKQYDAQLNITILGGSGTGKTSLMNAWLGSTSPEKTKPTIGYLFM